MPNEDANRYIEQAQDKLLEAHELYKTLDRLLLESDEAFGNAIDSSINKDCPQYQAIAEDFNKGYQELIQASLSMHIGFRRGCIARAIEVAKARRDSHCF